MAKYHWAKLYVDYFSRDEMRVLELQDNGAQYIVFWMKLLLKAVEQDEPGRMRFKEDIPYSDRILATVLNTDIDTVRSAMHFLKKLGLVVVDEEGTLWIEEAIKVSGSETDAAKRMRELRKRRRLEIPASQCYDDPSHCSHGDANTVTVPLTLTLDSSSSSKVREDNPEDLGEGADPSPASSGKKKLWYDFEAHEWVNLPDDLIERWREVYPAVDIEGEINKASDWCESAGAKGRKQEWQRFLSGWLRRAQDRAGSNGRAR